MNTTLARTGALLLFPLVMARGDCLRQQQLDDVLEAAVDVTQAAIAIHPDGSGVLAPPPPRAAPRTST